MKIVDKLLIVPDTHAPYHNQQSWSTMLTVARWWKPSIVLHLGDLADFYPLSFHEKSAHRKHTLEEEGEIAGGLMADLLSLRAKRNIYLLGNHEFRLLRYLANRAPELKEIVSIESLLNLSKKWEVVPYREHVKIGKVVFGHDFNRCGKNAVDATFRDVGTNVVIGHTHRLQYQVMGTALGEYQVAASFGWLGDSTHTDYQNRVVANREWPQGFGIGYVMSNGNVILNPVPIVSGVAVVEGRVFGPKKSR